MKKCKIVLFIYLLLLGFFAFQSDFVFADNSDKNVDIKFTYVKIEKIINLNELDDYERGQIEDGEKVKGEDMKDCWYKKSKTDGYYYIIRKTEVSTEEDLLKAMGAKSELFLKHGQKCLLSAFQTANSEKLQLKAEGFEDKNSLEIELVDTSNDGNTFGNGYNTYSSKTKPNIRKDFWCCSFGDSTKIRISDVTSKYSMLGKQDLVSTVYHEFSHFLDSAVLHGENPYGLDGTHYASEITSVSSAFIEGWAEYNEMIESKIETIEMKLNSKVLEVESEKKAGKYSTVIPIFSDFSTLLKSEALNANFLYELSKKIGQEKVKQAFIDLDGSRYKDLKMFVRRLVELYPEDTETICKVLDKVFFYKASDVEFYIMVGMTSETQAYVENRNFAKNTSINNILKNIKEDVIEDGEKIKQIGQKVSKAVKDDKEELVENISENVKKINKFGQKLIKALKGDKEEKEELVSKFKSSLGKFISNVKVIVSKGLEAFRYVLDSFVDTFRMFFYKDKSDEENYEIEETDDSDDSVKMQIIDTSDKENKGPSDNPFSIVK